MRSRYLGLIAISLISLFALHPSARADVKGGIVPSTISSGIVNREAGSSVILVVSKFTTPSSKVDLNPQPLPPERLLPSGKFELNPQPEPPGIVKNGIVIGS